jgi:predicted GNAT family N-acyltransferase
MIEAKFTHGLNADAKNLRQEVFVEEQGYQEEFEEVDKTAWHLVLYLNGAPIATGRILEEDPETYRIGRVTVKKAFRGHKVGTYLMKFLETKIRELGGRWAILDAQLEKKGFYEKCGYHVSDEGEIFYEEGHPHIRMAKLLIAKKGYKTRTKY